MTALSCSQTAPTSMLTSLYGPLAFGARSHTSTTTLSRSDRGPSRRGWATASTTMAVPTGRRSAQRHLLVAHPARQTLTTGSCSTRRKSRLHFSEYQPTSFPSRSPRSSRGSLRRTGPERLASCGRSPDSCRLSRRKSGLVPAALATRSRRLVQSPRYATW